MVKSARKVADDVLNASPDLSAYPELNKEFKRSALGRVSWLEAG